MHTNTKYWSLTWETNAKQKKIPQESELKQFLDRICDNACFQYELGSEKQKEHIQGSLTLNGVRLSKKATLELFQQRFKNISGLTLKPVYDKVAIQAYVTKPEGRVKGPFYAGKKELFDMNTSTNKLRDWQSDLYNLLTSEHINELKDRKVIWIQDTCGNTGKSWFQKYLRIGQKEIVARSLPVSSVDRLMSAVHIINREQHVDVYNIDLTRTQGEDQSFKDLFSAIEQIKNGSVIDVMYGKYNEAYFPAPVVIIYTNLKIEDYRNYLSEDRWKVYIINQDQKLEEKTPAGGKLHYYNLVSDQLKNNKADANQPEHEGGGKPLH